MKYITTIDETQFELELLPDGQVAVGGRTVQVDLKEIDGGQSFTLLVDGKSYEGFLLEENGVMQVVIEGVRYTAEVLDEHEKLLREVSASAKGLDERYELAAPMPGLVVKVPVEVGDEVQEGDVLVILESMKMQNELKAPQAGRVIEVNVAEGGNVEKRDVMVALGPLEVAAED
jgi:biotin carboxyl carrier protein